MSYKKIGNNKMHTCWCGHRYWTHSRDGSDCSGMIGETDKRNPVLCPCEAWEPTIKQQDSNLPATESIEDLRKALADTGYTTIRTSDLERWKRIEAAANKVMRYLDKN